MADQYPPLIVKKILRTCPYQKRCSTLWLQIASQPTQSHIVQKIQTHVQVHALTPVPLLFKHYLVA